MYKLMLSACICLAVIATGPADGKKPVAVSGQVFALNGSPAIHASVASFPVGTSGSGGNVTWVSTTDGGNFRLMLRPGRYIIRAKSEAAGYPDPTFLFGADPRAKFPEISVVDSEITGIRVTLGGQGGVVEGDLWDSITRHPIAGGKVTIRDARNAEAYVEVFTDKAGHFQFAVPSKPIQIFATVPGYKAASFDTGHEMTLSDGEHKTADIELQPSEP